MVLGGGLRRHFRHGNLVLKLTGLMIGTKPAQRRGVQLEMTSLNFSVSTSRGKFTALEEQFRVHRQVLRLCTARLRRSTWRANCAAQNSPPDAAVPARRRQRRPCPHARPDGG